MAWTARFLLPASFLTLSVLALVPAAAQQNPQGLALPGTAKVADRFTPLLPSEVRLQGGFLGNRVDANEEKRLVAVDENDLLDAFERRDQPHQDWQGEHIGKFLHAATLAWAYRRDPALRAKMDRVVARLLKTQEADGYLGTYPPAHRWTSWDVWVHKYDLLGLLTYAQFTGRKDALAACRRVGDLLVRTFGDGPGQRDINTSGEHMGLAPDSVLEPMVLLYRATGEARYRQFAEYIVSHYDSPGGPAVLTSLEKFGSVRRVADAKAYEMASNFNGLLELYRATGEARLRDDVQTAWDDITRNRLYLTGSASSFECFQDDGHFPSTQDAHIAETCFTVTWEQMNLQMLRLTGDPRFADEAERSIYNHLLAAQKPTGDDWCYYTPLTGHKQYDSVTTCCHSSGPRGIALIPSFAVMTSADGGLVVNLYNSGTAATRLPSGRVTVLEQTSYPRDGAVTLRVTPQRAGQRFPLRLRIPAWAAGAVVSVNGQGLPASAALPGTYAVVNRAWRKDDSVTLRIPLPERLVLGSGDSDGKAAVVRGPLVLALDAARNTGIGPLRRVALAADDPATFHLRPAPDSGGAPVWLVDGGTLGQSRPLSLVPFAFAGQDGQSQYSVWIARPGHADTTTSLLEGGQVSASRSGNETGDITDGDPSTVRVTFDGKRADEDWFAVTLPVPQTIGRVAFLHGRTFHDGGWFDTSGAGGQPRVQVQTEPNGSWKTVATLSTYPATTAADAGALTDGQKFEASFAPVRAIAVRVAGKPASGDNPTQAFSSCAELMAFAP